MSLQNRKLRAVVKFAYENVPYYHKLFNSVNLNLEDVRTKKDLVKIPITNKKILQELPISERAAKPVDVRKCMNAGRVALQECPWMCFSARKK